MSAAKLDELFRCYLLALLVEMQGAEGKSVPIPSTIAMKDCNANKHRSYMRTLGGLTSASYGLARDVLRQAGFGGVLSAAGATADKAPEGRPKRGKADATSLTEDFQRAFSSALADLMGERADTLMAAKEAEPRPDWKKGLVKHPGLIKWTSEQYIVEVGINGHLIEGLCDTGGGKTMIDVSLCEALGLRY